MYPFIDYSSGGNLGGMIKATDRLLEMAGPDTKIIAGHGGPVIGRDQLIEYRALLTAADQRMQAMIAEGKDLEAEPLAEFEADWGGGFINSERWIELIYYGMQK